MIAHLNGKLTFKSSTDAIIDCHGVGYLINISIKTSEKLPLAGKEAFVFTQMITREDSMTLYGFAEENERRAFNVLISISGIGPKIALGILSSVSPEELQEYIFTGNIPALKKLPGIGKKTAERLTFELKDKMPSLGDSSTIKSDSSSGVKQEACAALITLGFSAVMAEKAVTKAMSANQDASIEQIIKEALSLAAK